MNNPSFATVASTIGDKTVYRASLQHARIMDADTFMNRLNAKSTYPAASHKATCMGFKKVVLENILNAMATAIPGVMRVEHTIGGGFASSRGPWVPGKNSIEVIARALDPLKSVLSALRPVNKTEGAKPSITAIETNGVYDVIDGSHSTLATGTDLIMDTTKSDEFAAIIKADGTIVKKANSYIQNTLGWVEVTFDLTSVENGEYLFAVFTRAGLGDSFGVAKATRKITVLKAA